MLSALATQPWPSLLGLPFHEPNQAVEPCRPLGCQCWPQAHIQVHNCFTDLQCGALLHGVLSIELRAAHDVLRCGGVRFCVPKRNLQLLQLLGRCPAAGVAAGAAGPVLRCSILERYLELHDASVRSRQFGCQALLLALCTSSRRCRCLRQGIIVAA